MLKNLLTAGCMVLGLASGAAHAALYSPFGAQTNVGLSTVTGGGWTQCYAATMSVAIGINGENVLNNCNGDLIMMAGRETGSDTFLVLAQTTLADAIFDTGKTSDTHLSNGANWYFSPNWSWGFTAANDTVKLYQCDYGDSSPTSMCLHTLENDGGYRINDISDLNGSTAYEKVFFVASSVSNNVPEPGSLTLIGLGLAGLAVVRRRRSV